MAAGRESVVTENNGKGTCPLELGGSAGRKDNRSGPIRTKAEHPKSHKWKGRPWPPRGRASLLGRYAGDETDGGHLPSIGTKEGPSESLKGRTRGVDSGV